MGTKPTGCSQTAVLQCVAGAMYITGFAESIADVLSLSNIWAVRGISLAVLLGLLGINLAGVKWIIRLQLLLLLLLAVSTLDFVIGSFSHLDPGKAGGPELWDQCTLVVCLCFFFSIGVFVKVYIQTEVELRAARCGFPVLWYQVCKR